MLSKEQADWLIEQFNTAHVTLMTKPSEGMFHIMDCRAIIRECTAKPATANIISLEQADQLGDFLRAQRYIVDGLADVMQLEQTQELLEQFIKNIYQCIDFGDDDDKA